MANRITDLEKTLESWCNGQKFIPIFPSQMLMEEFPNDSVSVKSDDSKEKPEKESYDENNYTNKVRYSDSDDDINKSKEDLSSLNYENGSGDHKSMSSKIVLPQELEELVKEALAELKSVQ